MNRLMCFRFSMRRAFNAPLFLLAFTVSAGCTTSHGGQKGSPQEKINAPQTGSSSLTATSEVLAQPSRFDGNVIVVSGYLSRTELGATYLYRSPDHRDESETSSYLDVVPAEHAPKDVMQHAAAGCVVLSGKFRRYSNDFYGSGVLTSAIGILYVDTARNCGV